MKVINGEWRDSSLKKIYMKYKTKYFCLLYGYLHQFITNDNNFVQAILHLIYTFTFICDPYGDLILNEINLNFSDTRNLSTITAIKNNMEKIEIWPKHFILKICSKQQLKKLLLIILQTNLPTLSEYLMWLICMFEIQYDNCHSILLDMKLEKSIFKILKDRKLNHKKSIVINTLKCINHMMINEDIKIYFIEQHRMKHILLAETNKLTFTFGIGWNTIHTQLVTEMSQTLRKLLFTNKGKCYHLLIDKHIIPEILEFFFDRIHLLDNNDNVQSQMLTKLKINLIYCVYSFINSSNLSTKMYIIHLLQDTSKGFMQNLLSFLSHKDSLIRNIIISILYQIFACEPEFGHKCIVQYNLIDIIYCQIISKSINKTEQKNIINLLFKICLLPSTMIINICSINHQYFIRCIFKFCNKNTFDALSAFNALLSLRNLRISRYIIRYNNYQFIKTLIQNSSSLDIINLKQASQEIMFYIHQQNNIQETTQLFQTIQQEIKKINNPLYNLQGIFHFANNNK